MAYYWRTECVVQGKPFNKSSQRTALDFAVRVDYNVIYWIIVAKEPVRFIGATNIWLGTRLTLSLRWCSRITRDT